MRTALRRDQNRQWKDVWFQSIFKIARKNVLWKLVCQKAWTTYPNLLPPPCRKTLARLHMSTRGSYLQQSGTSNWSSPSRKIHIAFVLNIGSIINRATSSMVDWTSARQQWRCGIMCSAKTPEAPNPGGASLIKSTSHRLWPFWLGLA